MSFETTESSSNPASDNLSWGQVLNPMPLFEQMSERMGIGRLPDLFQAVAGFHTEVLRIAVHAPFVPFRVYADTLHIETPLIKAMQSTETAAAHVAETLTHNTEVVTQEAEKQIESAPAQKSVSP